MRFPVWHIASASGLHGFLAAFMSREAALFTQICKRVIGATSDGHW